MSQGILEILWPWTNGTTQHNQRRGFSAVRIGPATSPQHKPLSSGNTLLTSPTPEVARILLVEVSTVTCKTGTDGSLRVNR
jgi:hypothetical protein